MFTHLFRSFKKELKLSFWQIGQFLAIASFVISIFFFINPILAHNPGGGGFNPQYWLLIALQWIDGLGPLGAIAFILLYIVATVAFLPGVILTLGAGVIFGVFLGSLYVFIGATAGATAAFLVGRYLARDWVMSKIAPHQKFQALAEAVAQEGLKIVILTRLSPLFPFNLLNYGYGITGVSLQDYMLGSLGMIPGTIMYVYIGSLTGSLTTIGMGTGQVNSSGQWLMRLVGLIATVAVTIYVAKIAKKALDKAIPAPEIME